jgi:hypothetical protein
MYRRLSIFCLLLILLISFVPSVNAQTKVEQNTIDNSQSQVALWVNTPQIQAGQSITVSYILNNYNGGFAWILLYNQNSTGGNYLAIRAVNTTYGQISFLVNNPGQYEFQLVYKGIYYTDFRSSFTVIPNILNNVWYYGSRVTICAMTEFHVGPGLATEYVFDYNINAQVIGGPRYQLGSIWWNVSFGFDTDWVRQDQSDCITGYQAYGELTYPGWQYPLNNNYVQVLVERLRIRSGPGTNYVQLGFVAEDNFYRLLAPYGNWGLVQTYSGLTGYIYLPGYTNYTFR